MKIDLKEKVIKFLDDVVDYNENYYTLKKDIHKIVDFVANKAFEDLKTKIKYFNRHKNAYLITSVPGAARQLSIYDQLDIRVKEHEFDDPKSTGTLLISGYIGRMFDFDVSREEWNVVTIYDALINKEGVEEKINSYAMENYGITKLRISINNDQCRYRISLPFSKEEYLKYRDYIGIEAKLYHGE